MITKASTRIIRQLSTSIVRFSEASAVKETSSKFKQASLLAYGDNSTVSKILIKTSHDGEEKQFLLNKNTSTPFTCSKHLTNVLAQRSAIVESTNESGDVSFISLHSRLTEPCTLRFIDFENSDQVANEHVQQAFWRSGEVLLCAALADILPREAKIEPMNSKLSNGFMAAKVTNCSWNPNENELKDLSRYCSADLISRDLPFELVNLSAELSEQLGAPEGAHFCRVGDFEIQTSGPTIGSTGQFGKFEVVKTIPLKNGFKVAAIGVPNTTQIASKSFDIVKEYAQKKFV